MMSALGYVPDAAELVRLLGEASASLDRARNETARREAAVAERGIYRQRAADAFERWRRVAKDRVRDGTFGAWVVSRDGRAYALVAERYWEAKARMEDAQEALRMASETESSAARRLMDLERAMAAAQAATSSPGDANLGMIAKAWEDWVLGRSSRRPSAAVLWSALENASKRTPPARPSAPGTVPVRPVTPTPSSSGMAPFRRPALPAWAWPLVSPGTTWGGT